MNDPLITVDDLTLGWGETNLLEHASFSVERGEIFAILGGSGCGKSTLLRCLTGLDEPRGGSVRIDGVGAPTLEVGRPAYGVMFQTGALFGCTVRRPSERWRPASASPRKVAVESAVSTRSMLLKRSCNGVNRFTSSWASAVRRIA